MAELTEAMWQRALPFTPWMLPQALFNLEVRPCWFPEGERFWYRRETAGGPQYVVVEAASGTKRAAFDHEALKTALAREPGADFARLEILDVANGEATIGCDGRSWRFDGRALHRLADRPSSPHESLSPDGRLVAFRRDGDLWLREVATGAERRLTDTGEPHFEWAKSPDQSLETVSLRRRGIILPPILVWSPDSSRIFTHQLDERRVRRLPLVQNVPEDGSHRPVLHELRVAFTGDEDLPMAHQAIIEVATGRIVAHRGGPVHVSETSGIEKQEAWWSADSSRVFVLDHDRFEREITLVEIDAATGAERRILSETSDTFVDANLRYGAMPNVRILDRTGEVIWFSQRDGWAHLYLADLATGEIKAQITRGEWVVRDLLDVDEAGRRVTFLASGLDVAQPYRRLICRAAFDGDDVRVLTPEPGDHGAALQGVGSANILERATSLGPPAAAVSPDRAYVVDTVADLRSLGRTVLRRADGSVVAEIEAAATSLDEGDLAWPEAFKAIAADGVTPIHGVIWLPGDFDASRSYPVLDLVYPGPHCTQVPLSAFPAAPLDLREAGLARAIAELGIAVVMIDGRGTPYRSKAFHDVCHGNAQDPGSLTDHVAVLRQLVSERPYLDPARVGIMGHSAGGHAAARAILAHPEVFSVAIATAGCHDLRLYNNCWPEKWQGPLRRDVDGSTNYDAASNAALADRLQGKLLLAHGDMDDNVHPAATQRFAAALIDAGKDFDLFITSNDDHYSFLRNPHVIRRELEFLARNLL